MKKVQREIAFHYLINPFYFPQRNNLKRFILHKLKKQGKGVEAINYIFCDDDYLFQINKKYLNHRTFTDIITFDLSPKGHALISDIYISVERVKENALKFHVPFSNELLRVIFHGALHLLNFKDKSLRQAQQMRKREQEWLDEFAISRGTFPK